MRDMARTRGGKCLSQKYINVDSKLKWECANGHVWNAIPYSIKTGTWCPKCAGRLRTIDEMKQLAVDHDGLCLSKKYSGSKTKLLWQCSKGHTWEAIPESIYLQKTWCPTCAENTPHMINDLINIATKRGGKCLSKKYINIDTKYSWRCSLGHKFINTFNKVYLRGQWCPTCSRSGISEEVCRSVFNTIFRDHFVKYRPSWLRNSRGYQMELDGYSNKLGMAFEYQGRQHFKKNIYTKTNEALDRRILDDNLKSDLCSKNGITLFVITHETGYEDFAKEIKDQAKSLGIDCTKYNFDQEIDFEKAYVRKDRLGEIKDILSSRDCKLLSTKWLGVKEKYEVQCLIDNYRWTVVGSEIIAGAGCNKCARRKNGENQRLGIEGLCSIAKRYGGTVLSKKYSNSKASYKFRCKNGHVFDSIPNNMVYRKQWCPICEGRKHR